MENSEQSYRSVVNGFDDNLELNIRTAQFFMEKNYLDHLQDGKVKFCQDDAENQISLIKIERLIYDDKEPIIDKMISVYGSVREHAENMILLLVGDANGVNLFLGLRKKRTGKLTVANDTLYGSFLANFPGSKIEQIDNDQSIDILENAYSMKNPTTGEGPVVESISIIPSLRSDDNDKEKYYVQGLEKFIDAMKGKRYVLQIIATPLSNNKINEKKNAYEDIYSALSPFSKKNIQHGHNEGSTLTESITKSVSTSISRSVALSTGNNYGETKSKNSGFNIGGSLLASFGFSEGTSEGVSQGHSSGTQKTNGEQTNEGTTEGSSEAVTTGNSESITLEYKNKTVENLLDQIDENIKRIQDSASYGLWECAAYLATPTSSDIAVASGVLLSLLTGDKTRMEYPHLNVYREKSQTVLDYLKAFTHPCFMLKDMELADDLAGVLVTPTVTLSGKELPLMINMPRKSVPGVPVLHMAEFGRNPEKGTQETIPLGCVMHMGQKVPQDTIRLQKKSMTSHCFITGATGCGKSNTVYRILEGLNGDSPSSWISECDNDQKDGNKVHFLVIEPAKGEYKRHFADWKGINVFGTNPNLGQVLKINPFYFNYPEIHLLEHLDRLIEIFNNCWEMYAAMPAILKDAMERAYASKGWDILNSIYSGKGEPEYPTFQDLLNELPKVIKESSYSKDTQGDYTGALVTRVRSLTNGIYGQIFCDDFDIPEEILFEEDCIVDLSRVGSSETKSLIMGVLIQRLLEYRMSGKTEMNSDLRHVTVLEEAHNILKNSEKIVGTSGGQVVAKAVEMLVNGIAEMRTYGEGFIIVDQSPTAVDIAAIKNTNTKIIMRLPEMKDCESVGYSVSLSDSQIKYLSKLENGCAVVMQNNWVEAILGKVDEAKKSRDPGVEYISNEQLTAFKSVVLNSLLSEYAYKKTGEADVENVYKAISEFEITECKKQEMKRYISKFSRIMDEKFSSILFGKVLKNISGCSEVITRCEKKLVIQKEGDEYYTTESVNEWYAELVNSLRNSIDLSKRYRSTLLKYVIYAEKFNTHTNGHDYSELYQHYRRLM